MYHLCVEVVNEVMMVSPLAKGNGMNQGCSQISTNDCIGCCCVCMASVNDAPSQSTHAQQQ